MILSDLLRKTSKRAKVVILGKGYIGSYVHKHLKDQEYEHLYWISFKDMNYHDPKILNRFLLEIEADYIINCSGFTGRPNIDEAETKKEQCWFLNTLSPLQVANVCKERGVRYIHISSGCIYNGYNKEYTEQDTPNFGLYDHSSFYSKSKHAFETVSKDLPVKIIRIRMPFSPDETSRNYLTKLKNYDNLINYRNSKTYIPELCIFIDKMIQTFDLKWLEQDIYNVVNPEPLDTYELIKEIKDSVYYNPNWQLVSMDQINIVAPRSNCILNNAKANKIYKLQTETEALQNIFHI